jgi:glucose-6-phosphate dehydrogenase assembly protein OpcA
VTTLWDTTGTEVVKALAAERRTGGAMTSGCALTLIVVVGEQDVAEAEAAASMAASHHPCRVLMVIRHEIDVPVPRLDAEVQIGGRLGPGEAVVMRMYGRLALHAESVTLPLLAPDVPVVTWWHAPPPELIANDPLGVFAERRVTDSRRADDPVAALRQRAKDYAPGDTDLAWTTLTPWRSQLAAAVDPIATPIAGAIVRGNPHDASALLMAGWLTNRIGARVPLELADSPTDGIAEVTLTFAGGSRLSLCPTAPGQGELKRAALTAPDADSPDAGPAPSEPRSDADEADDRSTRSHPDVEDCSLVPLPRRPLGELLAEEVHHLDADDIYAAALSAATGVGGLSDRLGQRTHIWHDPAQPASARS